MSSSLVHYSAVRSRSQRLARIVIDNPPVNATSVGVRKGLLQAIQSANADACSHGLITCAGHTFVAGGDIAEFGLEPQAPHLPDVYQAFEDSPVIWAVLLHGNVLGAGLELALACDLRVAERSTRLGLPEVKLGLVPGAGGSQRLPRLIGASAAAALVTTGNPVSAEQFLSYGGLDAVHDENLEEQTLELLLRETDKPKVVSQRQISPVATNFFDDLRRSVKQKAKGAQGADFNIDALEWACNSDFEIGQAQERKLHLQLRDSAESQALRYVFFAERSVAKPAEIKGVTALPFQQIAIVGGGLMGSGIATSCLMAGLDVTVIEHDKTAAEKAFTNITQLLQASVKRKKLTTDQKTEYLQRLQCTEHYGAIGPADIVIEAVFEDIKVKQQVFENIKKYAKASAIIATNTSYLDPQAVAKPFANSAKLLGLHFFSPANIMKLLEIVKTPATDADVLATAFQFAARLKKTGVLSGVCDGFIGNRMLAAYRRQADYLLADGALPAQIDKAMRNFGLPMGPYELQDLTGLQIAWSNRQRQAPQRPESERYVTIADSLCELQRFGQRSGKGWYRYEDGQRTPIEDQEVTAVIEAFSSFHGVQRQHFTQAEIQQRLLAVLANEGARIVEEGIAQREIDVDMVKLLGYGFPRWRGGPMHYAGTIGDNRIKDTLQQVVRQSPDSWVLAQRYATS